MNVVVETNFILELAFMQEEHEACEGIFQLCEAGRANLVLPAFCIAEAYEAQIRRANRRRQALDDVAREFRELARSQPYQSEIPTFQNVSTMLVRSMQEESHRLTIVLQRIMLVANTIPLGASIMQSAPEYETRFGLSPQDAIVLASVFEHLAAIADSDSCFINRNKQDFDKASIAADLTQYNCKLLFSFAVGLNYFEHRLQTPPHA